LISTFLKPEKIAMRFLIFIVVFLTTINSQAGEMALTKGRAVTDIENLYECGGRLTRCFV